MSLLHVLLPWFVVPSPRVGVITRPMTGFCFLIFGCLNSEFSWCLIRGFRRRSRTTHNLLDRRRLPSYKFLDFAPEKNHTEDAKKHQTRTPTSGITRAKSLATWGDQNSPKTWKTAKFWKVGTLARSLVAETAHNTLATGPQFA